MQPLTLINQSMETSHVGSYITAYIRIAHIEDYFGLPFIDA
jgi:hypothetical protein